MYRKFAALYDGLMHDYDYDGQTSRLVGLLRRRLPQAREGVDLACGTGNYTVRLAGAGYRMIGCDLSAEMLDVARSKSAGLGILYVQRDLNEMRLPHRVDFATMLCDAVNYCVDGIDFARIAQCVRAGGLLVFDHGTERYVRDTLGNNFFYEVGDETAYLWQNSRKGPITTMDLTFFVRRDDGAYERFDERHRLRARTDAELRSGLEPYFATECFADDLRSAPAADAERVWYVCTRRED